MGEIVNLRQVRKKMARTEAERTAAENRARHGMTKAQKIVERQESRRTDALLNGHLRDKTEP